MKVNLVRKNEDFLMEATNNTGNVVFMDANPAIGGGNGGFRPMQIVLAGLAGCTSIDVLLILKKKKQIVTTYAVEIEGQRAEGVEPAVFTQIHIRFSLSGDLDSAKVEHAIKLSLEKYCSVAKMLEKTAEITYSYQINP
ncbi:MAG: OsmC family protein [Bacteroidia bacterium]|nr:OsmC family protein [Bacteroidia bacterium]